MCSIFQTNAVADKIVQPSLSNRGLVMLIAEMVGMVMDRAVEEYCLCDIEEVSMVEFLAPSCWYNTRCSIR